jgi:hypothetical protein
LVDLLGAGLIENHSSCAVVAPTAIFEPSRRQQGLFERPFLNLSWVQAGNTTGFGQVAHDPFWVGNFDGQAGDDILFYYPGLQKWALGRFDSNEALSWTLKGELRLLWVDCVT